MKSAGSSWVGEAGWALGVWSTEPTAVILEIVCNHGSVFRQRTGNAALADEFNHGLTLCCGSGPEDFGCEHVVCVEFMIEDCG